MAFSAVVIGGGLAAAGAYQGYEARKDAKRDAKAAAEEQRKARDEQKAINAQQFAQEKRRQIREERVRRARILQSAENTGSDGSSGMWGSLSGLSTQLGANLGTSIGMYESGQRISNYAQTAANFDLSRQMNLNSAANADAMMNLGVSIFSAGSGSMKPSSSGPTYNNGGVSLEGSFNPEN